MISQDFLKSILLYEPETGLFRWLVSRPPRGKIHEIAGYPAGHGYIKISISGNRYYAHRLAFLWMAGSIPNEVDHINQEKSDNRWVNLRESNRINNSANVSNRNKKRPRLGIRKRYGNWYARYGKTHLGVFNSKKEALSARNEYVKNICGHDPNQIIPIKPSSIKSELCTGKGYRYLGKTLSEWSRETGIPQPTLYWRIFKKKLSPQEALGI